MTAESQRWPETPMRRIMIVPNRSISLAGLWCFFSTIGAATLLIAGCFTWLGLWPVMVYAMSELMLLAYCFMLCTSQARYAELITVTPERVVVEQGRPECRQVTEFSRPWARVIMRRSLSRLDPQRLVIRSHGRDCEVGQCLTEVERDSLSRRLGELIGEVAAAPPLANGGKTDGCGQAGHGS